MPYELMNLWGWGGSKISRVKKSTYARNVGLLVRGNILAQLIQLLALPVISRLYSPENFGVFSLFISFFGFSVLALSLRLDSALLIADDEEVPLLVAIALWLVLFIGTFFTILLVLFQHYSFLGFEILPSWAWFVIMITLSSLC